MDIRRVILYAALVLVVYSLWINWQADYSQPEPATDTALTSVKEEGRLMPTMEMVGKVDTGTTLAVKPDKKAEDTVTEKTGNNRYIAVQTDVLNIAIDLEHGDIVKAQLLDYPVSVEEQDKPFTLLEVARNERYVANSGLFVVNNQNIENIDFNFTSTKQFYELLPEKNKLVVALNGESGVGIKAVKEFIFTKGSYLVDVRYRITNVANDTWKGYFNTQLLRSSPTEDKSSLFHIGSYTGASYSNPGQHR